MSEREAANERDRAARHRLADDPIYQIKQRRPRGGGPANSAEVEATWNRVAAATEANLTAREREVLLLVAEGHRNAEIAALLFKSENTVMSQLQSLMRRLGARDRANAVAIAIRRGLID